MYQIWLRLNASLWLTVLLVVVNWSLVEATIFGAVSQLHVWLTVSSVVRRHSSGSDIFRQIEINWINAPLNHDTDYIALYLDSQPSEGSLPVSVHQVRGESSGRVVTDYYLPPIDFYNETHRESNNIPLDYQLLRRFGRQEEDARFEQLMRQRSASLKEECLGYCVAYHSGSRMLAKNCLRTNPTWMHDQFRYIENHALPALMIPGTHNSGTYPERLDGSVLSIVNKYVQNQEENIFSQLVHGIRYLDLRVGYEPQVKHSPEKFWIYHDIFRSRVSVREALEQVKRFLEMTSHEIIIMDFHRFTVGFQHERPATLRERHSELIAMILEELGQFIVPSYLGPSAPLAEYISMGARLLVGYAGRDSLLESSGSFAARLQQLDNSTKPYENSSEISTPGVDSNSTLVPVTLEADQADDEAENTEEHSAKMISRNLNDYVYPPSPEGVSRAALFFPQIIHLWPNKDSLKEFVGYLNQTACRRHFGELRSLMVELTPTVFGVISDKYNGNRQLAEQVNRVVTDMVRDRWLSCLNIVASDYFLGNDLIRLSIHANKMRATHQNINFNLDGHCKSFRPVSHLLDTSKIARQLIQLPATLSKRSYDTRFDSRISGSEQDTVAHWVEDGSQVRLKVLTSGLNLQANQRAQEGESFLDSVSEGFGNLFASFKRLFNL